MRNTLWVEEFNPATHQQETYGHFTSWVLATFFRLNKSERLKKVNEARDILQHLVNEPASPYSAFVIFGSFVRGDAHRWSDFVILYS